MKHRPKGNKVMFSVGIILILVQVSLMLGNFFDKSTVPILLGVMGIVFIGASNFRLFKTKKQ